MSVATAHSLRVIETDVRRIWGAVRFVESTSARPIDGPLEVRAPGVRFLRNLSGLHVLMQLDEPVARREEFAAHEAAFEAPPVPDPIALSASVSDPAGRWLPRRFDIELPRSALPAGSAAPRFQPLAVTLDAAAAAPLLPTWAVLRVSVRHNGQPAANVAMRLQRPGGGALFGRGLSDARGEALVVAAGIAQLSVGDGEVVVQREVPADLVLSFDPAAPLNEPVNPDTLAVRAGVVRKTVHRHLASGRIESLSIDLP